MDEHQRSRLSKSSRFMLYYRAKSQISSSASLNGARVCHESRLRSNNLHNQQMVRHWHNRSSKEYLRSREPSNNLQSSKSRNSLLNRNHRCSKCSSNLLA